MTLRILHLSDNYPPAMGGLERSVQTVARAQTEAGHVVGVLTAARADRPGLTVEDGVLTYRVRCSLQRFPRAYVDPQHRVFFPPTVDPLFARTASRILGEFVPDIVHAHGWIWFSVAEAAARSGAAIVSTAHDYGAVCAKKTLWRSDEMCEGPATAKCMTCSLDHYGAKGIAISLGLRQASRRNAGIDLWTGLSSAVTGAGSAPRPQDRQPMMVIPSYVPDAVTEIDRYRDRPDFVPDGPYLFFAGALGVHKGVGVLLEAHRRLWSGGTQIPLVLAGVPQPGGPTPEGTGVVVARSVPHAAVMAGWVHAAIGVVPSLWPEPFGQTAVECLASGTPAVVSSVGGLTDIVEPGRSGLVVPPGDAGALAAAIQRLLDDPELSRRLGAGGRRRAEAFTVSAVLPQIEAAYLIALNRRDARHAAARRRDGVRHASA